MPPPPVIEVESASTEAPRGRQPGAAREWRSQVGRLRDGEPACRQVGGQRGVVLADDQPLIRAGFRIFVEPDPEVEVVGEAGTGREAVALARSERADVVLMDIRMPDMVAFGLSNEEIAERPHLSPLTVNTHITRAMTTFGMRDRAQLVVIAYQGGLVRLGEQP